MDKRVPLPNGPNSVNVDQNDSRGRRQSRQRASRIHRDRIDDPLSCDVCDELKRHNNVCTQRV